MDLQLTGWWLLRSSWWSCSGPRLSGVAVSYLPLGRVPLWRTPQEEGGSASPTQKPASSPLPGTSDPCFTWSSVHRPRNPKPQPVESSPSQPTKHLPVSATSRSGASPDTQQVPADRCTPNLPVPGGSAEPGPWPAPAPRDSPCAGGVLSAAGTCLAATLLPDHEAGAR